jgi:hypothetical protein
MRTILIVAAIALHGSAACAQFVPQPWQPQGPLIAPPGSPLNPTPAPWMLPQPPPVFPQPAPPPQVRVAPFSCTRIGNIVSCL